MDSPRIVSHLEAERDGVVAPDPRRDAPIGFPAPWPDRPWLFGVMVASRNGLVAWRRRDDADDPVLAVLGGDPERSERWPTSA